LLEIPSKKEDLRVAERVIHGSDYFSALASTLVKIKENVLVDGPLVLHIHWSWSLWL
jgi:hypothetical protein